MTLEGQYETEVDCIRARFRATRHRREGDRFPVEKMVGNLLEEHGLPGAGDGWEFVRHVPFCSDEVRPDCFICGWRGLLHAYIIKHPSRRVGSIVVGEDCAKNAIG